MPGRRWSKAGRRQLLRPGRREAVNDELRHHLKERRDRLVESGWEPEEAWAEAVRRLGDIERYRSEMLEIGDYDEGRGMVGIFEGIVSDIRYALRGLRREPRFGWALIFTLALGVGATGAIFSVLDAVMFRPLPYEEPDRLAEVHLFISGRDLTFPMLQDDQIDPWVEGADFFSDVGFHDRVSMVRTDGVDPESVSVIAGSPNLGTLLGMTPALGRGFVPDDGVPGTRVTLLSHDQWVKGGSDPDVVGQSVRLDDESWVVVGVMPKGFKFPIAGDSDFWVPLASDRTAGGRSISQFEVVGRLADGVSLEAAQARADGLERVLAATNPTEMGWKTKLISVGAWRGNEDTRAGLWMLAGAVSLMLLIALVNGTNLLLVRAQVRSMELGVRRALGASRGRLLTQLVSESLVLALIGGVAAAAIAWFAVEGISAIAPRDLTFAMVHGFGLEVRALAAVFGVATLAGLAVAIVPGAALLSAQTVRGSARQTSADRRGHRLRGVLVALEVGVSVVLLVGAGLFIRSFIAMNEVDFGAELERIAHVAVALPPGRYPSGEERAVFAREVTDRLRGLPGVSAVAVSQGIPPRGGGISYASPRHDDQPTAAEPEYVLIPFTTAEPGFVRAIGSTLSDGRSFTDEDLDSNGVMIDRDLARLVFGTERAAGKRFRMGENSGWLTVVGVLEELRLGGPDDQLGKEALIYPMDPEAPPASLAFSVRVVGDPAELLPMMRREVREVDSRLPLQTLDTGEGTVADALVRPRFLVLLMSVLSILALLLSAIGLFGVLSYVVDQRRREMGIRIAIGAPLSTVRGGVLRWGMGVAVLGTILGVAVSILLDDAAEALLYEIQPGDPVTVLAVVGTMLTTALLACWLPALRASRVDPVEVLKGD